MLLSDVLATLEEIAPSRFAYSWDKVGLAVGRASLPIQTAVVSLDHSFSAIEFARQNNAQLLLTHHPILMDPMHRITGDTYDTDKALRMLEAGIAMVCAHTNWDTAHGGINDALAERLGLSEVEPFGYGQSIQRYKVAVTVPIPDASKVREALAAAGAGSIGNYDSCNFEVEGIGRFRPLAGAEPAIGELVRLEAVSEVKIEAIVSDRDRGRVDRAIRQSHPYEEPAIDWYPLAPAVELPTGRIGNLEQPMPLETFLNTIERQLETRTFAFGRVPEVRRVAVVGGAAAGDWRAAKLLGADAYVTGEVKQHVGLEASEHGISLIEAGHYATEQPGVKALQRILQRRVPQVKWLLFEPQPGEAGRPLTR